MTTTTYTPAGRVASVTTPDGITTTTTTYDAAGRVWRRATPAGVTTTDHDLAGNAVRTTSPGGLVTRSTYDAAGRLSTVTDPAGVVTTYTYTARGEKATQSTTGAGTISSTYDPDGNLASVTDALGRTTTFAYDGRGRRTSMTDAADGATTWAYDAAGQLTGRSDPLKRTTSHTYDGAGRPLATTDPSGRATTRTYDAAGELTGLTYADGSTVGFTYDSAGRRASATDASGTTTYSYEPGGRLDAVSRPDGRVLSYRYDSAGRRTAMTLADGTSYAVAYDAMSRVASVVPGETLADTFTAATGAVPDTAKWAVGAGAGAGASVQSNRLSLAVANQDASSVTLRASPPATVDAEAAMRYRFADNSSTAKLQVHLRAASDSYWLEIANDSATITLNKQVGSTTTTLGSFTATKDLDEHRLRLRAEGTALRVRTWDSSVPEPTTWDLQVSDGSITTAGAMKLALVRTEGAHTATVDDVVYQDLTNAPSAVATYTYDADGYVTSESVPGGQRTWTWASGRLASLAQSIPGAPPLTTIGYDAAGRIASETTSSLATTFRYDAAGQLVGVTPSAGNATAYAYDALGRRSATTSAAVTTTYAYDAASQLTSSTTTGSGTTAYGYDGAGRRLSETNASGTTSYSYDRAGRLATYAGGATTQTRSYAADGALTAVANTTGSTTTGTSLDWDASSASGALVSLAGAATTTLVPGPLGPSAMRQGATATGLVLDPFGSVVSTPATSGVARAGTYDAFGVASGPGTFEPRLGYRGAATFDGLVHLGARDYQPATGVFTTADALEGVVGTPTLASRYHYADNDPLDRSDPSGLRPGASAFAGLDTVMRLGPVLGGGSGHAWTGCVVLVTASCLVQAPPRPGPPEAPPRPAPPETPPRRRPGLGLGILGSLALACALSGACGPNPGRTRTCAAPRTGAGGGCGVAVFMPGGDMPETTAHILDALSAHPGWARLTRAAHPDSTTSRQWYLADQRCPSLPGDELSCDEFPFFTTRQGGPGASLRNTPGWESRVQGGKLAGFFSSCGIAQGDDFLVVPMPAQPATSWTC